jgi:hypothetical protein
MPSNLLTFDEATHTYRVGGHKKPGVTGILKAAGYIDDRWFSEAAAWRGHVVHACCQLHCLGTLDAKTVDPLAQGYLDAWIGFKANIGFTPIAVEVPRYDPELDICGIPDRIGYLGDGTPAIVDLKTGPTQAWHALQLALYHPFCPPNKGFRRFGVRLEYQGRYTLTEFPMGQYAMDREAALAALTTYRWKRFHNVI